MNWSRRDGVCLTGRDKRVSSCSECRAPHQLSSPEVEQVSQGGSSGRDECSATGSGFDLGD